MEHCFRTALWVFFLIGHLQARPAIMGQGNMGLGYLDQDVTCGDDVKFTYPENVDVDMCRNEALQSFKDVLENILDTLKCEDAKGRIEDTLNALDNDFPSTQTNSTKCTLGYKESNFTVFVEDLESFVQLLNSKASQ